MFYFQFIFFHYSINIQNKPLKLIEIVHKLCLEPKLEKDILVYRKDAWPAKRWWMSAARIRTSHPLPVQFLGTFSHFYVLKVTEGTLVQKEQSQALLQPVGRSLACWAASCLVPLNTTMSSDHVLAWSSSWLGWEPEHLPGGDCRE